AREKRRQGRVYPVPSVSSVSPVVKIFSFHFTNHLVGCAFCSLATAPLSSKSQWERTWGTECPRTNRKPICTRLSPKARLPTSLKAVIPPHPKRIGPRRL